jgi:SAM-dependent methyltransferase
MMEHYYGDDKIFGENWSKFLRLYHDMVQNAPSDEPSIFVEVGCWKGRSTAYLGVEIINSRKPISLYCVDHFLGSKEHSGLDTSNLYNQFVANLEPVTDIMGDRFRIYHMHSVQAAARFKRPIFDFVFLDGSHEVKDVHDDIKAWLPKVKPGGVLAGDDWRYPEVRIAVEHAFGRGRVQVNKQEQWPYWRYNVPTE